MSHDSTWDEEKWTATAAKLAVLSEPVSLEVVHILTAHSAVELTEICRTLHVSKDYALRYLSELEQAGIVERQKTKHGCYYAVIDETARLVVDIFFNDRQ